MTLDFTKEAISLPLDFILYFTIDLSHSTSHILSYLARESLQQSTLSPLTLQSLRLNDPASTLGRSW